MEMTIQEAQDVMNVLAQQLNAERLAHTSALIQLSRVQRELANAKARIAELVAPKKLPE